MFQEHPGSTSGLLHLAYCEYGVGVTEHLVRLLEDFGECPALEIVGVPMRVLRSITEKVGFSRVSVNVEVELKPVSVPVFEGCCQLIQRPYFRVYQFVQVLELSVKVFAAVAGSEITDYNSVGIEHGNYLEFIVSQEVAVLGIPYQILYESFK